MQIRKRYRSNLTICSRGATRFITWAMLCLALSTLGVGVSATAQEHATFTTIDAPGAGTGVNQGTQSIGINRAGEVTGFYADSNNVVHGFVRAADGEFTTFDAPGAGSENVSGFQCTETGCWGQGTYAIAINTAGAVAGFYADSNNVVHGFVRAADGEFTTLDAPGVGTGVNQGTSAVGINEKGVIAGYYVDANGASHGFERGPDGKLITFDATGAGTGAGQGTMVGWNSCINATETIAGFYVDESGLGHGFVRASDGVITGFEAPGAATGPGQPGTETYSISEEGVAAGAYWDSNNVGHGFVLSPNGTFTNVEADIPGAVASSASDVNPSGAITGSYWDSNDVVHGFALAPDGKLFTFEAPGTGGGQGGVGPTTINPSGAITGAYTNAAYGAGVGHGFLVSPP